MLRRILPAAVAPVLALCGIANAADPAMPPTFAEQFEIAFGAGAEYGQFSSVGPYGFVGQQLPGEFSPMIEGRLSGWSAVVGGHVAYRSGVSGLLGEEGYRVDFGFTSGSASLARSTPFGGTDTVIFESVDATQVTGTGASLGRTDAYLDQTRRLFTVTPSVIFDLSNGLSPVSLRIGPTVSILKQHETIAVDLYHFDGTSQEYYYSGATTTEGDLSTHAFGARAAIDARLNVSAGHSFGVTLEGSIQTARTGYEGWSARHNPNPAPAGTASDSQSHLMLDVSATAGPEWTPAPGVTVALLGTVGYQTGQPYVIRPWWDVNPLAIVGGPAHIGFESRLSGGIKGEVRLRY